MYSGEHLNRPFERRILILKKLPPKVLTHHLPHLGSQEALFFSRCCFEAFTKTFVTLSQKGVGKRENESTTHFSSPPKAHAWVCGLSETVRGRLSRLAAAKPFSTKKRRRLGGGDEFSNANMFRKCWNFSTYPEALQKNNIYFVFSIYFLKKCLRWVLREH